MEQETDRTGGEDQGRLLELELQAPEVGEAGDRDQRRREIDDGTPSEYHGRPGDGASRAGCSSLHEGPHAPVIAVADEPTARG